jgi:hypothetical protein
MISMAGIIIWQESKMHKAFQQSIKIGEIDKYFLECRRQEKNFLIRQDSESMELYNQNFIALTNTLNETLELELSDKSLNIITILQRNLDNYNKKVEDIINSEEVLDKIQIQQEVDLAREIHSSINELNTIAIDNFNKAHILTTNVNLFSILIGFFLSVLIAGFISTKIMELLGTTEG